MSDQTLLHVAAAVPDADSEPIEDAGILIEGRSIASVGRFVDVRRAYPLAHERDATDLVALPGFVDAHSHGRGLPLAEQGVRHGPLELFLAQLTACTPLDPRDDAFVAGSDLLATGVTAVQVFFHSHAPVDEYRAAVLATADGLRASGIEYELVIGFTDQQEFVPPLSGEAPRGAEMLCSPERGLDTDEFFAVYDALDASVTLGPVAPQWCSQPVWQGVAERARGGARVHTHLLESAAQRAVLRPSPVETLRGFGVLGERFSAAHAVWLTDGEIGEVAAARAALVHCPGSNRKLAGGAARVRAWLDAGVNVALGLDSNARADPPDVFDELRAARESARGELRAREALRLATLGGAYALGRAHIGRLARGYAADVVALRAPARTGDLVEALLERATRNDVVEVWTNGELRVEDGRLLRQHDVDEARARLRAALADDAEPRRQRLAAVDALEPWLAEVWSLDASQLAGAAR